MVRLEVVTYWGCYLNQQISYRREITMVPWTVDKSEYHSSEVFKLQRSVFYCSLLLHLLIWNLISAMKRNHLNVTSTSLKLLMNMMKIREMSSANVWKEKRITLCLYNTLYLQYNLFWLELLKEATSCYILWWKTKKLLLISLSGDHDHIYHVLRPQSQEKTEMLVKHLLLFSTMFSSVT